MLEICTYDDRGRQTRHDLHALPFRDGKLAHTLDQGELYHRLAKLKVAEVKPTMGLQDLLLAYSRWKKEHAA
jgi:hypothetical protein